MDKKMLQHEDNVVNANSVQMIKPIDQ